MRYSKGTRWLALAAGMLVAACSDTGTPAEPSRDMPLAAASVQSDANRARHEELQREREEQKAYFKQMKEANRDNLRAAREEWKAWKADWKEQYKLEKESWKRAHPGEKGGPGEHAVSGLWAGCDCTVARRGVRRRVRVSLDTISASATRKAGCRISLARTTSRASASRRSPPPPMR